MENLNKVSINGMEYKKDSFMEYKNYGVSWASLGTVSVEEAKEFLKELELKIQEAEQMNNEIK